MRFHCVIAFTLMGILSIRANASTNSMPSAPIPSASMARRAAAMSAAGMTQEYVNPPPVQLSPDGTEEFAPPLAIGDAIGAFGSGEVMQPVYRPPVACDDFPMNPCCPLFYRSPCPRGPTWIVGLRPIVFARNLPATMPFITLGTSAESESVFKARQFGLGCGYGYDFDVTRRCLGDTRYDLQVRYFGLYGWTSTKGPTLVPSEFTQFAAAFGAPTWTSISSQYTSQLQSAETNLLRERNGRFQWLAGFRWVELADQLVQNDNVAFGFDLVNKRVGTCNDLFGGQFGGDFLVCRFPFLAISTGGKVGGYANVVSNRLYITQSVPGAASVNTSGSDVHRAFVGEFNLSARYFLTKNLWFRSSYEVFVLDGVATASDQLRGLAVDGSSVSRVSTAGTVVYNGISAGLEFVR